MQRIAFILLLLGLAVSTDGRDRRAALIARNNSVVAAGGGGFSPNAVTFDNTDHLTFNGTWSESSDTKTFILSFWVKFNSGDGTSQFITFWAAQALQIDRTSGNKLHILMRNGGGGAAIDWTSTDDWTTADGWIHVLASGNMASTTLQVYINDTVDSASGSPADLSIDWAGSGNYYFGADQFQETPFAGCISEFYLHIDSALDLSVESNRRKFNDGSGNPVDLGSDGATPVSAQPMIYMKGTHGAYTVNSGSGGNWDALVGTLTECTAP